MGSGSAHDDASDTPGMHETQTTDYAIVMEGEIWAVMETGETKLRAGDVLVQRGTIMPGLIAVINYQLLHSY